MSVINTNNLSLLAQKNLSASQNSLSTAMQRLSSGLRINSAKDDAAGQAIANRMTANIRGLTQASRNANDGISIAQTTEGSLNEINNNLQRIRELTVQASNGSNSGSDLSSIQAEINERLSEIDRVSRETQFNGKYILGSDADKLSIQVGANDGERIDIKLSKINSDTLGLSGFSVESARPKISDKIEHVGTGADKPVAPDLSAVAEKLKVGSDELSLHNVLDADGNATDKYAVKHGDKLYAVESIDDQSGEVELLVADVTIKDNTLGTNEIDVTLEAAPLLLVNNSSGELTGMITYQGKNYDVGLDGSQEAVIDENGESEQALKSSSNLLSDVDDALQKVDNLRSHLGAIQNRFESTISNLNNTVSNLSAARSRIEDADYAVEVSNMTRAQILQQAGTTVLAQSNQLPQTVLSLLR